MLSEFDPTLATALQKFLEGQSVADFGCGDGDYVECFRNALDCIGVIFHDKPVQILANYYRQADIGAPLWLGRFYDWALCLEIADSIDPAKVQTLLFNLDQHAKEGIILSWGIPGGEPRLNPRENAEVEAMFATMGYTVDDATRDDLREAASLPAYRESLMVFRRKQGTARYVAQFIGGPLHRKKEYLTCIPAKYFWTDPAPDPTRTHGLLPGNVTHRYALHENLIDLGIKLHRLDESCCPTYFYEG